MSDLVTVNRDLTLLAPGFGAVVERAIAKCNDTSGGRASMNAIVFEGFRSQARQAYLYAQGRTRPGSIVTRAPTSLTSWHGYGLAVDVVHKTGFWAPFGKDAKANERWFADVAAIFKQTHCNWGGDWTHPDTPHMQWSACAPSPSDTTRALMISKGAQAVWDAVGALEAS